MAKPPGEWEYLYKTTPVTQIAWELGGPDVCLERLIHERKIPAKARIIDFGCGLGSAAVYLAALGHSVTAVDLSQTAIEKATRKAQTVGVPVTFIVGDALTTGLKGKSFDVIYDRGCLEHLRDDRQEEYGKEVKRLLTTTGRLVAEVTQERMSVDDLKRLLGSSFTLEEAVGATHVDRPTNIPRYYTSALFARK